MFGVREIQNDTRSRDLSDSSLLCVSAVGDNGEVYAVAAFR